MREKNKYFTLDLERDKFAYRALMEYAIACSLENPELARELEKEANDSKEKLEPLVFDHRFGPGSEQLWNWFGLSYANYLTIPRAVLMSMPDEWQKKLVHLLYELDFIAEEHNFNWPENSDYKIEVRLRDEKGRYVNDKYSQYRHLKNGSVFDKEDIPK